MPEFALDSATWRRLRSSGYIAAIAAVIIAAMLASNVNDSAHAAEKPPTVTWTRTVTNVDGRNMCKYNATVTTTPGLATRGMLQAAAALAADYESPSDGKITVHSKPFVCPGNTTPAAPSPTPGAAGSPTPGPAGSPTPGPAGSPTPANRAATNLEPAGWSQPATGADVKVTPVSFADVRNEAAGNPFVKWLLGAVVGFAVAAVVAIFGATAIIAAGAAVGVAISAELAGFAAACLAGATGGAVGEFVKGNTAAQIATSAILGCAGGLYISKFTSPAQAASVMGDVTARLSDFGRSATQEATTAVTGAAIAQLPELAPAANSVVELTQSLSNAVGTELRRSASL